MITSSDLRWFSDVVRQLHTCTTEDELHERLLPTVHAHFRAGVSQIEEVAFDLSTYRRPLILGGRELPDGYLAALQDSPIVAYGLRSGWARETLHLSELATNGALQRTSFFNVVLRQLKLGDQLMGILHGSSTALWEFGVNRDDAFSARERTLFDHLRRHVEAVLLRIRRSGGGLAALPGAEVVLGADLRPQAMSAALRSVLHEYFLTDRGSIAVGVLPESIRRWVVASLQMLARRPPPHPLTYLRTAAARGWLLVRVFPSRAGGGALLRFNEERREPDPFAWRAHGLTTRECEVLHWLMAGKRDSEIAVILGTTTRTVEKHVEHVLRKLHGVNRVEAVALAAIRLRNTNAG